MKTERNSLVDLADEAKKRVLVALVCVFGISYLMSLTSSSVLVNLPAAICSIILFRYVLRDFELRKRSSYSHNSPSISRERVSAVVPAVSANKLSWRRNVDSPVVESAIDQLTNHLISEWVTDLWYSRITPDKDGPEELILLMNNFCGEISSRARDINLIKLLTRDVINLVCNNLELYRSIQTKIGITELGNVSSEHRDAQIMLTLVSEKKLHPALVSAEDEHKVLQHLISGLLCLTFKAEDLNCAFFRHTVRELLACTVIRPILNMANPMFINEKIELAVNSLSKVNQEMNPGEDMASMGPSKAQVESSFGQSESSGSGVELLQLKPNSFSVLNEMRQHRYSIKDATLPLPEDSPKLDKGNAARRELGATLGVITARNRALVPENFDNMWTGGRGCSENECENHDKPKTQHQDNIKMGHSEKTHTGNGDLARNHSNSLSQDILGRKDDQSDSELESEDSYQGDEDDEVNATGLDSPVTMVWESKNKRHSNVSRIRHPLESFETSSSKRNGKSRGHHLILARSHSGRKRLRTVGQKVTARHGAERNSLLSDGKSDLKFFMKDNLSAGSAAASSLSARTDDSFLKLKSEVIGANIVKGSWETFAVYSISVTDGGNNSWSIKRRFRHFEELHRRLKEFPDYNLHLPPKHYLSSGLDFHVIDERCRLLDKYLKMLLGVPTLSGSIEVWDFLSVDSQTYIFSDSFSIVQTLSVDLANKQYGKGDGGKNSKQSVDMNLHPTREHAKPKRNHGNSAPERLVEAGTTERTSTQKSINSNTQSLLSNPSTSNQSTTVQPEPLISPMKAVTGPTFPMEWISPNLSAPLLDLFDVVFQLNDGGWIRRQVFWVAKQVLQLGMGDALDDWIIQKIQLLRTGSFVASAIYRIEQILWPDGIFLTKHPTRKRRSPAPSPTAPGGLRQNSLTDEERREAVRRAEFVYDLIIHRSPSALVGLIGRKTYEQCAHDVYYFLQSSVCLKQLAYELVELLLLALFPEMDQVIQEIHQGEHLNKSPSLQKN